MSQLHSKELFGNEVSDFTLFPIQGTATQFLRWIESKFTDENEMAGAVLADTMGLGKTKTCAALFESNLVETSLFICPLTTVNQASVEFLKTCKRLSIYNIEEDKLMLLSLNHDKTESISRQVADFEEPFILVINKEKITAKNSMGIVRRRLYFRVILDEAHVARNGSDTNFYNSLCKIQQPKITLNGKEIRFGTRFAVTGTPIQNGKDDLYWIFRWIDDRYLTNPKIKNEELTYWIRHNLFRRTELNLTPSMKRLMEFPIYPPEITTVNLSLPDTKLSKQIESLQPDRIKELCEIDPRFRKNLSMDQKAFTIVSTIISRDTFRSEKERNILSMKSVLSYPFAKPIFGIHYEGDLFVKLEAMLEIITNEPEKSFIIFHYYDPIKDVILDIFKDSTYFVRNIGGPTPGKNRQKIINECNKSIQRGKPVILLLSLKATSESLNCQSFDRMICMDQDANPQVEIQAFRRIYRVGQQNLVKIWILSLESIYNAFRIVDVDSRLEEIKSSKIPSSEIIDEYNAAWYFRQYTYTNDEGIVETGVHFSDEFDSSRECSSEGPIEIN
jgi:SNF2 family DNA or RNA helicase